MLTVALFEAHHPHTQVAALPPYCPASQVQVRYLASSSLSTFTHLFTNTNTEVLEGQPQGTLAPCILSSLHDCSHFPSLERLPCFPCALTNPSSWLSSHKLYRACTAPSAHDGCTFFPIN